MKKITTVFFLLFLIIPSFYFYCILFGTQNEKSEIEQRTLQKIPKFSIENFSNTKYQTDLENGIADQLLMSEELKYGYHNSVYKITNKVSDFFDIFF